MARKVIKRKTRRQRKTRRRHRRRHRGGGAENGDYAGVKIGLPKNGDYSDIDAVPRTQSIEQPVEEQEEES